MSKDRAQEIDKGMEALINAAEELKGAIQSLAVKTCKSPIPNPYEYLIRLYEVSMMITSQINNDMVEATMDAEKQLKKSFQSGTFKDVMNTEDFKKFEKDWRHHFDRR